MFVLWSFLALGLTLFAYIIESMFNNTHALFERTSTPRTVSGPFRRFRENHNFLLVRNLRSADAASLRRIIVPSVIAFVAMSLIGWLMDGIWSDGWVYVWYVLASVSIVAMVGLIVYFVVWWFQGGTTLLELLAFVPLFALMWLPLKLVMSLFNTLLLSWNWVDPNNQLAMDFVRDTIPIVMMVIVAGLLLFHYFYCRWKNGGRVQKGMGRLAIIVLCLALLTSSAMTAKGIGDFSKSSSKTAPAIAGTSGPTDRLTTESTNQLKQNWLTYQQVVKKHSYLDWNNFQLQSDGNPDNNMDFGPNRYHEDWTEMNYLNDMKRYEQRDLLILIAHIATVDAAADTDMVGDYYNGNNHDWSKTMNTMVRSCLDDKTNRIHLLEVFQAFWDNEVRGVRVVHMDDVHDQMRITPYTYDGIPKIVAAVTRQSGDILLVTFRTKGGPENDVTVGFRINCCYQPIGVIDLMDLTDTQTENPPEYVPDNQMSTTPDNPPTPATTPDNPPTPATTPDPGSDPTDPTEVKPKDPADDPVNNGNAQKGGGDNKSTDGSGEYQAQDPRTEKQDPDEVKPETPTVVPEHKAEEQAGQIVDHENKMDYAPDPVTNRGPVDNRKPVTNSNGDGEFVPGD